MFQRPAGQAVPTGIGPAGSLEARFDLYETVTLFAQ